MTDEYIPATWLSGFSFGHVICAAGGHCCCVAVTTCDRQRPITILSVEGCPQAWLQEEEDPFTICLPYGTCSMKDPK